MGKKYNLGQGDAAVAAAGARYALDGVCVSKLPECSVSPWRKSRTVKLGSTRRNCRMDYSRHGNRSLFYPYSSVRNTFTEPVHAASMVPILSSKRAAAEVRVTCRVFGLSITAAFSLVSFVFGHSNRGR